jgi:hypothetical protein
MQLKLIQVHSSRVCNFTLTIKSQFPIIPYTVLFKEASRCVDLAEHAKRKMVTRSTKDALAGPFDDIPVHVECKSMDYEVHIEHPVMCPFLKG